MGAALHLAHAHQALPGPKRKRKGGGSGGDGYDKLVANVYHDNRHTSESRELILLTAWLLHRDPERHTTETPFWERAGNILGRYKVGGREKPRLADLIAADRPRYEPDYTSDSWQRHACAAPMIRRDGLCGQLATAHTQSVDLTTGWTEPIWYCRRHTDWGRKHEIAYREARKTAPEPIPNAGGLIPSYLTLKTGDEGWIRTYKWACKWMYKSWEPSKTYSLRADDWPTPGVDPAPRPPQLRLIVSKPDFQGPAGDDA